MNATLSNGGKVHRLVKGQARCGVGRNAKTRSWQTELGEVTCGRCVRLEKMDGRKGASRTGEQRGKEG